MEHNLREIVPFAYQNGTPVRTAKGEDDEPWFVLSDLCEVLEIRNSRAAAARLDQDEVGTATIQTAGLGARQVTIVSEPGMYELVLASRTPEAKALKRWLTHEVLPAIRQTGRFLTPDAKQEIAAKGYRISQILDELPTASATRTGHLLDELRLRVLDEMLIPLATPEVFREVAARHGIPAIQD